MKQPKKFSDTSIRVLETLKVLVKKSSSIQDIITHFEKIDPNNRIYTNEVILKYINTLKVAGYKFVKQKDKYVIQKNPNQLNFNKEDLEAIYLIENLSKTFHEEKIKTEISKFLQELEKRFDDNTKLIANNLHKPGFVYLDFNYDKYSDQIKKCEAHCIEGQKIKITYKNSSGCVISENVEPNEIKYKGKNVYLNAYNPLSANILDINLDDIIEIVQLPSRSNPTKMPSTVTFIIKDRLANGYRLHNGEKLIQTYPDKSKLISSQKEDKTFLLKRLMRYGANCEVVSPKDLRAKMAEMIDSTLNYYK